MYLKTPLKLQKYANFLYFIGEWKRLKRNRK